MPISRVTGQDAKGATTATGATAYPGLPTAGHLLLASALSGVSTAIDLTTGGGGVVPWTKVAQDFSGANNLTLFAKKAEGNETTVAITGGSGITRLHLYEYQGFGAGATIAQLLEAAPAITTPGSATTATTPGVTLSAPGADLVFATAGLTAAVTSPSVSAPFNLLQVDTAIRLMDADRITSAAGAVAGAAFSWTTAASQKLATVAFRQDPSTGQLFFFAI